MIPEFVGRLPVIATLDPLDEDALIRILTEPKNALVKQYQKLFEMETSSWSSRRRRSGHRQAGRCSATPAPAASGSIIEDIMTDVMYEAPSRTDVAKCIITKDVVLKKEEPILVPVGDAKSRRAKKEESA